MKTTNYVRPFRRVADFSRGQRHVEVHILMDHAVGSFATGQYDDRDRVLQVVPSITVAHGEDR